VTITPPLKCGDLVEGVIQELLEVVAAALAGPPDEQKVYDTLAALAYVTAGIIVPTADLGVLEFYKGVLRGFIRKDETLHDGSVH
jgi:hypothetical protein